MMRKLIQCIACLPNVSFLLLQDLTMTKFQVSADKQFILLAYDIKPVSLPPPTGPLRLCI